MFALMTSLEIVVLAAAACLIGYFMGRVTYRPPRDGSPQEAPFLRERIDSLEAGYAVLLDERDELKREVVSYATLEDQLRELKAAKAAAWEAQAELEQLHGALAQMTIDLDELQAANGLAEQLEHRLAAQDEHISHLEVALQEQRDVGVGLDFSQSAPGDHGITGGSGMVTDAVIAAVE
jgi:hypothetical protein